jgi:spore germination protein GerM
MSMLRRAVLALAVAAVVATGCGIPSDDEPRAIPEGAIDEQVAGPPSANGPDNLPSTSTSQRLVYLVTGESPGQRLIAALVPVENPANSALLPRLVLEDLIRTRPADVNLAGLATNQLPSDTSVLDAVVQPDGVLDLNLSDLGIEGPSLRLAMAQIVFTATELPGIGAVRVSIEGRPVAVPTESGSAEPGTPITKSDYATLNPDNPASG